MTNSTYCKKCDTAKSASDFHVDRSRASGLSPYCKSCNLERSRARRKNDPRSVKNSDLMYKFNITLDRYESMLEVQGGTCAICGLTNENGRMLAVDHDHSCCPGDRSCGKCVRSLLCGDCNMGLGKFKDSVELLKKAIAYLT